MATEIEEKLILLLKESIDELDQEAGIGVEDDLSQMGVNSVSFIKLVVAIEEEFDFEFDDDQLEHSNFNTVKGISEYIQTKINE